MKQFEATLARFFSLVLHPLFIPTFGVLLLFRINTYVGFSMDDSVKRFILMVFVINTIIAPVMAILLLKRTGIIHDLLLDKRNERIFPLLISALFYILAYYLLKQAPLPSLIYYYLMGASFLVLVCLVVTFHWKISIHMMSMGGFTGFLIAISLLLKTDIIWIIMLAILLSGFVGASRIRLNAHTPLQVYAGYLLGLVIMLSLYVYLRV